MSARRVSAGALAALILVLAGCGGTTSSKRSPKPAQAPLVPGARVVARAVQCDRGASAFCSVQLVAIDPRYKSSEQLADAEHDLVERAGWTESDADTGDERAAESPGHKLRLTYAAAYGDLKGIDVGWIHRSRKIALALSKAMFDRVAAISVELDHGSS
jgi:hypothetical protein